MYPLIGGRYRFIKLFLIRVCKSGCIGDRFLRHNTVDLRLQVIHITHIQQEHQDKEHDRVDKCRLNDQCPMFFMQPFFNRCIIFILSPCSLWLLLLLCRVYSQNVWLPTDSHKGYCFQWQRTLRNCLPGCRSLHFLTYKTHMDQFL